MKAYLEKLEGIFASGENLDLDLKLPCRKKAGDGSEAEGRGVIPQKQPGLYAVKYHPIGGSPDVSMFGRLYERIAPMEDVEVRLSPDESLYVINLTGSEAKQVMETLSDGAKNDFEESVACIGASICQVGVRDSQKLLQSAVKAVRDADLPDGVLPQIHISGCPSSCGTHQIGAIGFRGGVKMIDKKPQPAFVLFYNGCDRQGSEQMGKEIGVMLEEDIPQFLIELGSTVRDSGMDFAAWVHRMPEGVERIASSYLR